MNRGDELDRDISLALAKRVESDEPSYTTARRLQREGKKPQAAQALLEPGPQRGRSRQA